jgi:hypothetical protein
VEIRSIRGGYSEVENVNRPRVSVDQDTSKQIYNNYNSSKPVIPFGTSQLMIPDVSCNPLSLETESVEGMRIKK